MPTVDDLTTAAARGDSNRVDTLLWAGVDPNGCNVFGRTALQVSHQMRFDGLLRHHFRTKTSLTSRGDIFNQAMGKIFFFIHLKNDAQSPFFVVIKLRLTFIEKKHSSFLLMQFLIKINTTISVYVAFRQQIVATLLSITHFGTALLLRTPKNKRVVAKAEHIVIIINPPLLNNSLTYSHKNKSHLRGLGPSII